MAVNPNIPLQAQTLDLASPLATLIQSRERNEDRQMMRRQEQRQQEQFDLNNQQTRQAIQTNAAQLRQVLNSQATQDYLTDALTVRNLISNNDTQNAGVLMQSMLEKYKGTPYAQGLDVDLQNLQSGNIEPVLKSIDDDLTMVQQVRQVLGEGTQAQDPASVREFQFIQSLTPEQQQQYMVMKRAAPQVNLGDRVVIADPTNPAAAPIAEFQRELAPGERPETRGAQAAAVQQAEIAAIEPRAQEERRVQRAAEQGQRIGAIESKAEQTQLITELVDQARDFSSTWTTGFIGSAASRVPGTPAFNLARTLDTLQATAGFDTLQQMRDNSPTGGALGQVTERELALLQSTWGSVVQAQSKEQFERALDRFQRQIDNSWQRVNRAYERDYGEPYFTDAQRQSQNNDPLGILQ